MRTSISSLVALMLLLGSNVAHAHTWIETVRRISKSGSFTGPVGFQRGFQARGATAQDPHMVNKLEGQFPSNAPICKDTQRNGMQGEFPRVTAAPGDSVAMQYLENGHVTLKLLPRPKNQGNVYIYGTKNPSDAHTFNGIHKKWKKEGTSAEGKLLATRFYDDGLCYQVNPNSEVFRTRAAASGNFDKEVPCQTDVKLPEDAGTDGTYTLYWVWDFALMNAGTGKVETPEFYTACIDIAMTGTPADAGDANAPSGDCAAKGQLDNQFLVDPLADNEIDPFWKKGARMFRA